MSDKQGLDKGQKPYNTYTKLHAYSGNNPKGLGTSDLEEWLHLSKDEEDRSEAHAELVADLRYVASDDFDITEHLDLLHLNSEQFDEILLTHVLDYIEWKNQEDFLVYIWNLLDEYGRLKITTRNFDLIREKLVKKRRFTKSNAYDDWAEQMYMIYSSTCPSDTFLCCHTKDTLKYTLLRAGFGNIMVKINSDHLEVTCIKNEK